MGYKISIKREKKAEKAIKIYQDLWVVLKMKIFNIWITKREEEEIGQDKGGVLQRIFMGLYKVFIYCNRLNSLNNKPNQRQYKSSNESKVLK